MHVLNGVAVSAGLGLVQLALLGAPVGARAVLTGAIFASLPHLPDRAGRVSRRVLVGGLLACATAAIVIALRPHPLALAVCIPLLVFTLMMAMAWGARAGPIAFASVLAIVFSLALPPSTPVLSTTAWSLVGVLGYVGWTYVSTVVLESRYRTLATAGAVQASATMLRARASMYADPSGEAHGPSGAVEEEAVLATRLQTARDLVFRARETPLNCRQCVIILQLTELRDILLASRLDLSVLGDDEIAQSIRAELADRLRALADALDKGYRALRDGVVPRVDPVPVRGAFREAEIGEDDPRARLLPVVRRRLEYMAEAVERIHALIAGAEAELLLSRDELLRFAADERWPLDALRKNLSLDSPVLRHALRIGLAVGLIYVLASVLPWAPRRHWLVLSVAVVLRGTLRETLTRRNARVVGTAIGCVLAVVLVYTMPEPVLRLAFLGAAGAAHAFVMARYLLTATAASVMALLQIHFTSPATAPAVIERIADTIVGAFFAWGFSYVLPTWERRSLPRSLDRSLRALREYADASLSGESLAEQRLTRQRAYEELETLALALKRSAVEPAAVRPPTRELRELVERAQILLAHLSSVRFLLLRRRLRRDDPDTAAALTATAEALQAHLALQEPAPTIDRGQAASEAELPPEPADKEPLPWLLRRLHVTVYDAARVGDAARTLLAKLG
jgi:uncharacterized membrane protein YccC